MDKPHPQVHVVSPLAATPSSLKVLPSYFTKKMLFWNRLVHALAVAVVTPVYGFSPSSRIGSHSIYEDSDVLVVSSSVHRQVHPITRRQLYPFRDGEDESRFGDDNNDEDESTKNPYADPNYPQLEFIDYSNPEYRVDMGLGDELFWTDNSQNRLDPKLESEQKARDDDWVALQAMHEERRRRNDEYQFQTYFANILKNGDEFKGEWTIYRTSTFLNEKRENDDQPPRLIKATKTLPVVSQGCKVLLDDDSGKYQFPLDRERILHKEFIATEPEVEAGSSLGEHLPDLLPATILKNMYWPESLCAADFRGPQGIMCVSNAYTTATAVRWPGGLTTTTDHTDGPFSEYRTEVGLTTPQLRFRIKLDYAVLSSSKGEKKSKNDPPPPATFPNPPPLYLRSLVVCREMLGRWPQDQKNVWYDDGGDVSSSGTLLSGASVNEALFGIPGADNGLYDPPPVGTDDQAVRYLQMDLDGHATALFPYKMDQTATPKDTTRGGWVVSLDWMPGVLRYQVDRKVRGGVELLGLRTLELSEVRSEDAETYRPRDGGRDMRQ